MKNVQGTKLITFRELIKNISYVGILSILSIYVCHIVIRKYGPNGLFICLVLVFSVLLFPAIFRLLVNVFGYCKQKLWRPYVKHSINISKVDGEVRVCDISGDGGAVVNLSVTIPVLFQLPLYRAPNTRYLDIKAWVKYDDENYCAYRTLKLQRSPAEEDGTNSIVAWDVRYERGWRLMMYIQIDPEGLIPNQDFTFTFNILTSCNAQIVPVANLD